MKKISEKQILSWIKRIQNSSLPVKIFFDKYKVPFKIRQYYIYCKRKSLQRQGHDSGLVKIGGNRKINKESQIYLEAVFLNNPQIKAQELQKQLKNSLGVAISLPTISRFRKKFVPAQLLPLGRPKTKIETIEVNPFGGFELIIAIAHYLNWPVQIEKIISSSVNEIKKKRDYIDNEKNKDLQRRNKKGHFTTKYNQLKKVRNNRFSSIHDKVKFKNWRSMNIFRNKTLTIARKNIAILSLPIITSNGKVRTINIASGQSLKYLCGFNFKQKTLEKYMSELKYLGISEMLLKKLGEFWKEHWKEEFDKNYPMLCYYIDGNTKALWSSERVKQNKVTMLGRVMGCLEQMFIHDNYGNPIYFETHSGHGPVGKRVLELFKKVEDSIIESPKSRTNISRVIVMDSANNSVETLRSFAAQNDYFYITPLDDNQWNDRKILKHGKVHRYEYGEADLNDVTLELKDSKENKYLITTSAIRIDWDNGKKFTLLHNLPTCIDSSEVVVSYFKRWPCQELRFREYKSSISINRVAGYGKKLIEDKVAYEMSDKVKQEIDALKKLLQIPLEEIEELTRKLSIAIKAERKARVMCSIKDGKRVGSEKDQSTLKYFNKKINSYQRDITEIKKTHEKVFKKLKRKQQEWFKLQGKKTVYQADVELDQIMTFYRLTLANLFAYFIKNFLGGISISMVMLIERVMRLQATINISHSTRVIKFHYNKSDPDMMTLLSDAFRKMNKLKIKDLRNNVYNFSFQDMCA